jgi:hypothetical protein
VSSGLNAFFMVNRQQWDTVAEGVTKTHRIPIQPLLGSILALALVLQCALRRTIDRTQLGRGHEPELLYLSSGQLIKHLSLGFDGLLADVYWTRTIQYYGRERLSPHPNYSLLGPLLRITTLLDPHLLVAYRFGAIFLAMRPPDGAGEPQQAMDLLRRGIVANPEYWRLWEDLGFIEYWDLHHYVAAARIFKAGSTRPGAQIWMKTLAASVAARGGEFRTSQLLWTQVYQTAENAAVRKSAMEHLAALKAHEDLQSINQLLDAYRKREERPAQSLQELVTAGMLRAIPVDPSGLPYVLSPDGAARLSPGSPINLRLLQ